MSAEPRSRTREEDTAHASPPFNAACERALPRVPSWTMTAGIPDSARARAYSLALLDQLLAVVVTCTLISYCLYTFVSGTADHTLMITIPFVIFGIFRYLYLLYVKGDGERPDELLWRDRQILGSVARCVVAVLLLLYVLPC